MSLFGRLYTVLTGTSSSSTTVPPPPPPPSSSTPGLPPTRRETTSLQHTQPSRTVQKRPRSETNDSYKDEEEEEEETLSSSSFSRSYPRSSFSSSSSIPATDTTPSTITGTKRLRISPSSSTAQVSTVSLPNRSSDNDDKFSVYKALTKLADVTPFGSNLLSKYIGGSFKTMIGGNSIPITESTVALATIADQSSRLTTSVPHHAATSMQPPRLESPSYTATTTTIHDRGMSNGPMNLSNYPINPVQSLHVLRSRGASGSPVQDNVSTTSIVPSSSLSSFTPSASSRFSHVSYASNVRPPSSLLATSTLIQQPPEPNPNSLYYRVLEQKERQKQQQYLQSISSSSSSSTSSSTLSSSTDYIPSFADHLNDNFTARRVHDAITTLKSLEGTHDDMNTIQLLDNLIFKRTKVVPSSSKKPSIGVIIDLLDSNENGTNDKENHPHTPRTLASQSKDAAFERSVLQWKQSLSRTGTSSSSLYRWLMIEDSRLSSMDYETLSTVLYPLSLRSVLQDAPSYREKIIGRCDSEIVTLEKVQCLNDETWLNDEVINFHMKRLFLRNRSYHPDMDSRTTTTTTIPREPTYFLNGYGCHNLSKKPPRVWVCSSFFLTTLMGIDDNHHSSLYAPRLYSHRSVAKWSKHAKINLAALDLVIVPINIPHTHWALAVLDVNRCSLHYYDSMNTDTTVQSATVGDILNYTNGTRNTSSSLSSSFRYQVCASIAGWAVDEYQTLSSESIDPSSWLITVYPSTHVPQQTNSFDCGMFMCCYATCISQGIKFNFTQKDMPYERRKLVLDIVRSKADGSGLPEGRKPVSQSF